MAQFSVYLRFTPGKESAERYIARIRDNLPTAGKVHIVGITDKQYENARIFAGESQQGSPKTPDQYVLF